MKMETVRKTSEWKEKQQESGSFFNYNNKYIEERLKELIIEQDDAVYAMEVVSAILQLYEYKLNLLELEKLLNKNKIK